MRQQDTAADLAPMNRRVWALAGPIILSNITVPLIGVVDTAVVGHLPSPHYIGAVAVGALVFNYLFWSFGFLRMGTTGLAAQAAGAGDTDEVRSTLARALLLAGALGLAAIVLQVPILSLALGLIVLVSMFLLLRQAFRSSNDAALVMINLPLALVGGVVGLGLTGGVLSVATIVGFITLFGIATRNGVIMVDHIQRLLASGAERDLRAAVIRGAEERLAPILMMPALRRSENETSRLYGAGAHQNMPMRFAGDPRESRRNGDQFCARLSQGPV